MRFFLLLYLALASPLISQQSRSSVEPFTETLPGNYEVVSLELRKGLRVNAKNTEPQILQLSFRERKLSNFWFIDHGWEAMHPHGGELQLGDKGISGDLVLRMYDVRGRNQAHAHLKFKVERIGNAFSGKIAGKVQTTEAQDWQTSAQGTFIKPAGVFSEDASWPSFAGPNSTLSTSPNSPSLLDDLRQSQPRWRTGQRVVVMQEGRVHPCLQTVSFTSGSINPATSLPLLQRNGLWTNGSVNHWPSTPRKTT
jgi:hypothetical protein